MITHVARIVNQVILGMIKLYPPSSPLVVPFRCWPVDLDLYIHMNNSSYVRVAEYARWRILPSSEFLKYNELKRLLFIVVDQDIVYRKSIGPFQKYIVSMSIETMDDKYLIYTQKFLQHPSQVTSDKQPKESSGKTFRPSEVMKISAWTRYVWKVGKLTEISNKKL